ncbi:uncharacterized protein MONOS_690 [Monocercomonoides exilis]|uniref:uncharacterized protein n=1 Tax=Monocercomonoides exilis TaxID=2049356 RepID=UPI0035594A12|nr:hypothetical protein MONOS_690 [Monocercomonoides exilis]|eukprot:MONOS_690.1-p1 / transcript=MONOS_690.1 / gene=MONOS_690 / organism=Monocercomonoides_exilis_PA203 / gene_product=unspecified product / transcript_product=unspecified product / location=Mono_scaffold00011:197559-198824(+) / protein_length=399 / sequence_SO=supercontig / SO=protein_coding / is_pseudo=false
MLDEMCRKEQGSTFTNELYNDIDKMIVEKKISMENAILILKHIGYFKMIKNIWMCGFNYSSLSNMIRLMIIEEEEKKEEMNEKRLVDLCECYLLHGGSNSFVIASICVPCLLKVASNKDENEEVQKEVEMELLALSCVPKYYKVEQRLHLREIKDIIKHHQEHHNLTRLAYQSVWLFLVRRFVLNEKFEMIITDELHFLREARGELEDLEKCVDWKRKEILKENEERKKDMKNVSMLIRWFDVLETFLISQKKSTRKCDRLIMGMDLLCRAAKYNFRDFHEKCIGTFQKMIEKRTVYVDELVRSGVGDSFLEWMMQSTLDDGLMKCYLRFVAKLFKRLNQRTDDDFKEARQRFKKRRMLERMEEEGFEDEIFSISCVLFYFKDYYDPPNNLFDYMLFW